MVGNERSTSFVAYSCSAITPRWLSVGYFYARDATPTPHNYAMVLCLSVCPSQVGVLSKWMNLSSWVSGIEAAVGISDIKGIQIISQK